MIMRSSYIARVVVLALVAWAGGARAETLNRLVATIASTHEAMRNQAVQSVNTALTIRNWIIGHYIAEFEQKGEDRAKYGGRLL